MSSVFPFFKSKNRKGVQKRAARAQSPPSPASFVSKEVNETFNPYSLHDASLSSLNQHAQRQANGQDDPDKRASSPKVRIDFTTDGLSLSDWFPAELLQSRSDSPAPRPERNASLAGRAVIGNGHPAQPGGNLTVNRPGEGGLHSRTASSSGRSRAGSHSTAGTRSIGTSRMDEGLHVDENVGRVQSYADDDVIVIEAPRGRDPALSPLASRFNQGPAAPGSRDNSVSGIRRLAPEPLKIPPHPGAPSRRPRPVSVVSLPETTCQPNGFVDDDLPVNNNAPLSRNPSQSKSRRGSLTRSRSRLRSRPASTYSRYSDTDIDYDDNLSAISGTTIARALVSSYLFSPSSAVSNPSGQPFARSRGHLARQDSATLPRGELPFSFNRRSIRSSKGSLAASSRAGSTYWKDRRISGNQIVLMSPEERAGWERNGAIPPVPALPEGLSPEPSPYSSRSRKTSPNSAESRPEPSAGLTAEWRRSNGGRRVLGDVVVEPVPDRKRRRISRVSDDNASQVSSYLAASGAYSTAASSQLSLRSGASDHPESDRAPSEAHSHASHPHDEDDTVTNTIPVKPVQNGPATADSSVSQTSSHDTPGYDTPSLSHSNSVTSADSANFVRTPVTSSGVALRSPIFRSFSDSSPRKSGGSRPSMTLLPIGDRPRSAQVNSPSQPQPRSSQEGITRPYSLMSPLQPPTMPASKEEQPESPDLLDIMFAGSRMVQRSNGITGTRVLSPPAPISVPPPNMSSAADYDFLQDDPNAPFTASAVQQTFPETPYAFTPLVSAGFATPALPAGAPPPLPRSTSTAVRSGRTPRSGIGKKALVRHATMMSPPTSAQPSGSLPMTPPASASAAEFARMPSHDDIPPGPQSAGVLSAIEEGSLPDSPLSSYTNTPEHSPAPTSRQSMRHSLEVSGSPGPSRPPSLVPAKRSLTPLPSPPASSVPLPPSPLPSPAIQTTHAQDDSAPSSPSVSASLMEVTDNKSMRTPSPAPSLPLPPSGGSRPMPKIDHPKPLPTTPNRRFPRRPPPPTGPRKLSGPSSVLSRSRSRNGSVSSVGSPPAVSAGSSASHMHLPASMSGATMSASSPRFQTTNVKFRGLTMEAAQWTFTSQQLQAVVSSAIKKSSDPSFIRLLPVDTLSEELPEEISRLEALSAELRTNYKLAVRKRRMLLGTLRSIADGGELAEQAASARLLEDVSELTEHLDHLTEDLYNVTDQLSQLNHVQDLHFGSALAMAVRKLNTSFVKHLAEKESLRQQVATLEAERDEAWMHAQEAARELDDLTDKVAMSEGVLSPASSRRSSKISLARKTSVRKANLRSPSRLRSQHSSMASRSSMSYSPALRTATASVTDMVPPVPPIPLRAPLGISTSNLPIRSAGITSDATPDSEIRAMQQAQEELCQMLGISPEDLHAQPIQPRPKRSMSMSATLPSPRSARSLVSRSNSVIYTPGSRASETWPSHQRSRSIDDRTAVLASIGMASV